MKIEIMENNNEYSYNPPSYSDEEIEEQIGYTTATKPDPETNVKTVKRSRLSKAARVCMWIVGSIAGITVIFTCVLVWISGLQFLGVIGGSQQPEAVIEESSGNGDVYNFYIYDEPADGQLPSGGGEGSAEGDIEDYFDYFFGGGGIEGFGGSGGNEGSAGGNESAEQQGRAGLGITILALELEFTIDGKYTGGLVIDTIEDYSAFIGTDVRVNDMIVAVEGEASPNIEVLQKYLAERQIGDELTMTIARYSGGVASTFDVTVKLIEMQD